MEIGYSRIKLFEYGFDLMNVNSDNKIEIEIFE